MGYYTGKKYIAGTPGTPAAIKVGDTVKVTVPGNRTWVGVGTVRTANYYGEESGWYIEFDVTIENDHLVTQHYGYWKQGVDGGSVEVMPASFGVAK
jgi:hypothetical protein